MSLTDSNPSKRQYCYPQCRDPWFNECADCWKSGGNPAIGVKADEPKRPTDSNPSKRPDAKCGQEYGENTVYWPCRLPKGHNGPHEWDSLNRAEWERDEALALSASNPSKRPMGDPCRYCNGTGWRTEYVGSRFAGTEYHAHPVTVRCWACNDNPPGDK